MISFRMNLVVVSSKFLSLKLDQRNVSSLLRLHGVKAGAVGHNRQSLEFLGQLSDGEVLLSDGVQVTEISVDSVVLHDGDTWSGTQYKLSTGCGLGVIGGGVHAGVSAGCLVLVTT